MTLKRGGDSEHLIFQPPLHTSVLAYLQQPSDKTGRDQAEPLAAPEAVQAALTD